MYSQNIDLWEKTTGNKDNNPGTKSVIIQIKSRRVIGDLLFKLVIVTTAKYCTAYNPDTSKNAKAVMVDAESN